MGRNGGGRDYKKGHSGGPGRPPLLPEIKQIGEPLTREEYNRLLNKTLEYDRDQLRAVLSDPKTKIKELALAAIASKAVALGDPNRWESILNRAIGPVKQEAQIDATVKVVVEDYTIE